MQLHDLKLKTKRQHGKRVGRGGKRGTTSGRGTKGQKARAGHKIRPAERDILKRIPKLRGYKFKSFRPKPVVLNLRDLENKFKNGDTVSPETLLKTGLVSRIKGKTPRVKILGDGELKKNLIFQDIDFSDKARFKIGGQTPVIKDFSHGGPESEKTVQEFKIINKQEKEKSKQVVVTAKNKEKKEAKIKKQNKKPRRGA